MNLDEYEKADIEIKEPADIYRAMLDGFTAQYSDSWKIGEYRYSGGQFCSLPVSQKGIDAGYWTIWHKKPKKEWWELVNYDNPIVCRYKMTGNLCILRTYCDDYKDFDPLTDAEIDQLKRGL